MGPRKTHSTRSRPSLATLPTGVHLVQKSPTRVDQAKIARRERAFAGDFGPGCPIASTLSGSEPWSRGHSSLGRRLSPPLASTKIDSARVSRCRAMDVPVSSSLKAAPTAVLGEGTGRAERQPKADHDILWLPTLRSGQVPQLPHPGSDIGVVDDEPRGVVEELAPEVEPRRVVVEPERSLVLQPRVVLLEPLHSEAEDAQSH